MPSSTHAVKALGQLRSLLSGCGRGALEDVAAYADEQAALAASVTAAE